MRVGKAVIWLPVLALLHIHLHHRFHGPEGDYVGLALGAGASWVGLPGPGESLLIAAGVLAGQHRLDIGSVIFVAWAGATLGGAAGWSIGKSAGRRLITARGPFHSARVRAVDRGERVFERYPVIAIVLTPSWIAGINQVKARIYHPTNAVSAVFWAAGIGFGAYLVGPTVVEAVNDLGTVLEVILVVAVVALVVLEVRRRRRRGRRLGEDGPAKAQY